MPVDRNRSAAVMRRIVLGVALLLAAVGGWRLLGSLNWRMSCDAPLMNYIASRMLHGAVPYRDVLDMNMPGVYWLHEVIVKWFGTGDTPMRVLDLAALAAICVETYLLMRHNLGIIAAFGVASIVAAHLSEGPNDAAQRDFVMLVPLLAAALFSISFLETGSVSKLIPAGLAIGLAALIKPTCVLLPAALIPAFAIARRTDLRGVASLAWSLGLPIAAVVAGGALVLASEHALIPFLAAQRDFVPLYAKLHKSPAIMRLPLLDWQIAFSAAAALLVMTVVRLLPFLCLIVIAAFTGEHDSANHNLSVVCAAFAAWAVASVVAQGKGFVYHADPLTQFVIVWGAAALGDLIDTESAILRPILAVPVVLTLALIVPIAKDPPRSGSGPLLADHIAADLGKVASPTDSVQVLDMVGGGIHALVLLGMHEPTPFMYDFSLLGADSATQRASRAEFLRDLTANPPRAVVVTNQQWPDSRGFDQVDSWTGFAAMMRSSYGLRFSYFDPESRDGYRVYVRND